MVKNIIFYIIIIFIVMFTCSCEHKDLCLDHSHSGNVDVVFDWRYAPNANPKWMEVYFLPYEDEDVGEESGYLAHFQITNHMGGKVKIKPGHYHALCFSPGEGSNRWKETANFEEFEITTRFCSTKEVFSKLGYTTEQTKTINPVRSDNENYILEPDVLYSDFVADISIIITDEPQTVTFYPRLKTQHYIVHLTNVKNIHYTMGITGSLSGMPGGYYIGLDRSSTDMNRQDFDMNRMGELVLTGDFMAFFHNDTCTSQHWLDVYVILLDGTMFQASFDVTEKLHEASAQSQTELVITIDDEIEIPKPIVNGNGFKPQIDNWYNEEEIEVFGPNVR